eukprot:15156635-Alexandrium_andersonii.AAC.1
MQDLGQDPFDHAGSQHWLDPRPIPYPLGHLGLHSYACPGQTRGRHDVVERALTKEMKHKTSSLRTISLPGPPTA